MNHTPKPWVAVFDEVIRIKDDKGNTLFNATHLIRKGGRRNISEVEANARIAAAAPELLEACEDALESVRSGELYTVHLQEILSTAISKARGEK